MMWWKRKKLTRLHDELKAIALQDMLYASRTHPTEDDLQACAMRHRRQSELLAEIARLSPTTKPVGKAA